MYNVLVFLGLIFGKILGLFTKDEIREGKKYFRLIERILIVLIIIVILPKVNFLGVLIGLVLGWFLRDMLFLGFVAFFSNYLNLEYGLLVASLIFLYLLVISRDFKWLRVFEGVGFFLLPLVLLLVGESFINANLGIFLGICVGGPVAQLGRATVKR